jgi:hypothetical protein
VLLLALAACAEHNPEQPLTPFQIRDRLVGHTISATDPQGKELTMRFRHSGIATVTGATSEFVHWSVDAAQGLCLRGFEGQNRCAPVYQTAPARFRWDDTTLSVLGTGAPRLRGQAFPGPDFHRAPLLMRPR